MSSSLLICCTFLAIYLLCHVYFVESYTHRLRKVSEIDPEIYQDPIDIITNQGYKVETHSVTTDDGYILTLFRILPKRVSLCNIKRVVFLQHGLLDSAHTWINNLANESLAFILSDHGYDVWLGNSRGSTYSQKHETLDLTMREYWDFSWDEMAKYDLPACVDYVKQKAAVDKIFYIGHSQGTQMAFARFHDDPNLQDSLIAMAALAPVAYVANVQGPIRYVAKYAQSVEGVVEWFGNGEFLPSNSLLRYLDLLLCRQGEVPAVCKNIIFLIAGFDTANTNRTRLPVYIAHTPAGTSVKNMVHQCQNVANRRFSRFDYGEEGNMLHYGQPSPPDYHLSGIRVPIAAYHGGRDWLSTPADVDNLIAELGDAVKNRVYVSYYNHMDFVWGMDAAHILYADMLAFFAKY